MSSAFEICSTSAIYARSRQSKYHRGGIRLFLAITAEARLLAALSMAVYSAFLRALLEAL